MIDFNKRLSLSRGKVQLVSRKEIPKEQKTINKFYYNFQIIEKPKISDNFQSINLCENCNWTSKEQIQICEKCGFDLRKFTLIPKTNSVSRKRE